MYWYEYEYENEIKQEKMKEETKNSPNDITWSQKVCIHHWHPIVLIISTVYNCEKCGIKKEVYEKWKDEQG